MLNIRGTVKIKYHDISLKLNTIQTLKIIILKNVYIMEDLKMPWEMQLSD